MRKVVPIRTDLDVRVVPGRRDDHLLDLLGSRRSLTGPLPSMAAGAITVAEGVWRPVLHAPKVNPCPIRALQPP